MTSQPFDPITGFNPFHPPIENNPAALGQRLELFFSILLGAFTVIGGITFLIYFLTGAFNYLTAQGDPEKVRKAQRYLSYAVIGLIVIVMTWSITGILSLMLGFDILSLIYTISQLSPLPMNPAP